MSCPDTAATITTTQHQSASVSLANYLPTFLPTYLPTYLPTSGLGATQGTLYCTVRLGNKLLTPMPPETTILHCPRTYSI
ncbi:hypothetical protein LZ31DRAFT_558716 [Colletotrichum somersetense]|nr:hypothetical protein LZ31DRAFT_558716 [Colletotrichum somersetense]